MKFVSFHSHTTHSHGDGFGTVREHVERVASLGMSALGVSEHGNVNSHVALEREANQAGIKPIFGIESYFAPPKTQRKFHLGLYAMDEEGYRNLNRIVTQSYLDFYQYPTVSWENLRKHNAGIAVLSGCSDSLISCTLLGGKSLGDKRDTISEQDFRIARRRIERFLDVFGDDRFFLEVQRFPGLDRTCTLNPAYARLSRSTGVSLIATADVHYPHGYQNKIQTVLHASRRSSSVAVTEASWEYNILLTYPESDNEVLDDLVNTGLGSEEALASLLATSRLADACNVELPKAGRLHFPVPSTLTTQQFLHKKIKEGWKERMQQRPELAQDNDSKYQERIRHELKVIREKGFEDYFLAVAELVKWAKDNDITVGPARGSAASSLVCYLLGITEIDPLHPAFERMVFERFIDPTRSDMPDIDLDFDDDRRHELGEHAREIYGQENVANVGNHIKYRGKKALQDVARAHSLGLKTFDAIGNRCAIRTETDERVDDSILDVIEGNSDDPAVGALVERYRTELLQAIALEGNQHSMGIHAGGYIISSEPITDVCAVYTKEKSNGEVAQVIPYEKRDAEYLNFLKMDFLGLKAMGMIGLCRKWTQMNLRDLYSLFYQAWSRPGLADEIMARFNLDDVDGIFQYEGGTTRQLGRRLGIETFDHLAAVGALSRPGPYYGGQADAYIAVKNGDVEIESIHPEFDKHVGWTYGQIVYQEQIMWILRDLAGFDIAKVLRVRKIIGKKLGEHQFAELWNDFKAGCGANGLSEQGAKRVWGAITTAAGYAFNIAHAYSYALVAWWQMYFKIKWSRQFFAASLAKNGDGKDDLPRRTALLQDAIRHGIAVKSPNPTMSQENWTPLLGNAIQAGFLQINGVGSTTARDIVRWRKSQPPWEDKWDYPQWKWEDFLDVKGIGGKTLLTMKTFAAEEDPFGIYKTGKQLARFMKQLGEGDFDGAGLPGCATFWLSDQLPEESTVAFVGLVQNVVYRDEIETIRTRTGQTIDEIKSKLSHPEKTKKATIFAYDEKGEVALRISRFRYPDLARQVAGLKENYHLIVVEGKTYEGKGNSIQVHKLWVLDPD